MELRRFLVGSLIAMVAAGVAFGATNAQIFEGIFGTAEYRLLDWRIRAAATDPPQEESDVSLILFDSATVNEWDYITPFPRPALADLIEAASETGAKAIGLDVFLERRHLDLDRQYGVPGDSMLAEEIRQAGNVVIVGPSVETDSSRVFHVPHPMFAEPAAAVADASTPTPFETIRDVTLTVRTDTGLVAGFALAMYAQARDLDLDSLLAATEASGVLEIPGLPRPYAELPEDQNVQNMPVLFVGPPSSPYRDDGAFIANSAVLVRDVWNQPEPLRSIGMGAIREHFRDKVVVLGSGFHAEERFRSPFYDATDEAGKIYGWTYGTEVHATALHNLLTGRFIIPLTKTQEGLLLLLLAGLVTSAVFWRGVTLGAAVGLVLLIAELAWAWFAFAGSYLHVPMVGPASAALFAFIGSTSYTSIVEGKEKRVIRGAFSKYLSPAIVDELVDDPSKLMLGGAKREITILFSDLAGFTSLSETMEPEDLLALLNRYLDEMAEIVLAEGGTLDKYIGDAIMALYGAPTAFDDHALRCCRTALSMQRRLRDLNREWTEQGLPWLRMRIGINTGSPVVGNIGGEKRFDYTALGDAVNLAARLEPACKTYGIETMISGNTHAVAGDELITRELELLAVYGKEKPVPVYELAGLKGEDLGERDELFRQFNAGLDAYRNRDFELAMQYFEAASGVVPTDGPTLLYIERCQEYLVNPPPEDWDAVERRQVK